MSEDRSVSRRGFLRSAAGASAVAGATGVATAEENGGTETVSLVDFAYEPGTESPLYITPGTTVEFVWETSTHNINVDSQPDGANWEGHMAVEDEGFEYSHTFETTGTYEFHCDPHIDLGMEGTIVVNESGEPPGSGGGEHSGPVISDSAKTLGIATFVAMTSTLGLAFVLLKYGGGPPREGVEE